ncbi:hypothetical protein FRB99_006944 [Tulasnella sp. 403]|nr:hypothetical protein FRB99_006944 [Tulasnella sp. 403]
MSFLWNWFSRWTAREPPAATHTIFVGSYTKEISTLEFDPTASPPTLKVVGTSQAGSNPSWIAPHPTDKTLLFASNEEDEGKIVMFKIKSDKTLEPLQSVWSGGAGTAHFHVGEKEIVTANVGRFSGTLQTIPLSLNPPALLAPATQPVKFAFPGTGPVEDRQEASHPHQVAVHPSGQQLLIPDLGGDKIWKLGRDPNTQSWKVTGQVSVKPGYGPRHLAVRGEFPIRVEGVTMYVINELESSLSAYSYDATEKGEAIETSCLSMLTPPAVPAKGMLGAEVLLSEATAAYPEALVYASNRNDPHEAGDSIAIFSTADSASGFQLVNEVRTGLNHLRAVAFGGKEDKYLVAGGLNGGGIKIFERVDQGKSLRQIAHLEHGVVERPTSFVVM